MSDFDVVVIGAGPGGYVAAIRCAQLGLKTACIDRWVGKNGKPAVGGTCLNVGCIPSKALLNSSERYEDMRLHAADHGINSGDVSIDVEKMLARKDKIVLELTDGISALFKSNKIVFYAGHGCLVEAGTVRVSSEDQDDQTLAAKHVILASGSQPVQLPGMAVDNKTIFDSSGALEFPTVPKTLGIIGAGVIGLELGSVWRRLGAEVVILEAAQSLLGSADSMIAREAKKQFSRQGLDIRLGCKVTQVDNTENGCSVHYLDGENNESIGVERLIVAVGRRPVTDGLLDSNCGVALDDNGAVLVDADCATAVPGVWAIGDAVRGPMLAHKASEEGIAVAERIAVGSSNIDHSIIPWVIYTHPEIAWVGATEEELKAQEIPYTVGLFPFAASGRAKAVDATDGFIKILAGRDSDQILGAHMIGSQVSELINEAVLAMSMEASAEDLARTVHAHPTLAEAVHEAALAAHGRAIHKVNR
ncbi:MAG TPA: dihydrolipoyl dehydrogenase [Gammaproteobacteria bacterium]|jgi:dihydrolipoamide dehydrogenase|nr:dihydrolipoyl dehydrogenase [Gammaproteobacteria bacterium]HCL71466.1 dihydrolipoyl dehydrogenase [Gammaproteobacteria bacterium]